jgi:hypothetical protein
MPYEQGISTIPTELAEQIAGHAIPRDLLLEATNAINPTRTRELDEAVQIVEMYNINQTANRIEKLFEERNLPPPSVFAIHSLGWEPVFDAQPIGRYGKTPFTFLPPTDIGLHDGIVTAGKIDASHSYLGLNGRSDHPYEWEGTPYGNRIAAFALEVIKELSRRENERGGHPGTILTYVVGVLDHYPLGVGDIAVMMDDAESGTPLHPGKGSRKLTENTLEASRFQPKLYRASTTEYARAWLELCNKLNVPAGTATVWGTLGSPEYQSFQDMAMASLLFKEARRMGFLDYAHSVYPQENFLQRAGVLFDRKKQPSPVLGMGETFELAAFRETAVHTNDKEEILATEKQFQRIAVALITDKVGAAHANTRHESFAEIANRTKKRNRTLVEEFAQMIVSGEIPTAPQPVDLQPHNFSLKAYFETLK